MKRFDRHIGTRDAALQETPKVLQAIRVYAAIYVLRGMVNDLVRIVRCESFVGHERIGVEGCTSSHMLAYFLLQYGFTTAGNDGGANLSAALQDSHDGGFIFGARASDSALALYRK